MEELIITVGAAIIVAASVFYMCYAGDRITDLEDLLAQQNEVIDTQDSLVKQLHAARELAFKQREQAFKQRSRAFDQRNEALQERNDTQDAYQRLLRDKNQHVVLGPLAITRAQHN